MQILSSYIFLIYNGRITAIDFSLEFCNSPMRSVLNVVLIMYLTNQNVI